MNKLYYGDNLSIMRNNMKSGAVDLIYLDPPFKSQQNYNLIYKTLTGKPVHEQAVAFCDTWEMDAEKERLAKTMPVLMRDYGVEDYYIEFWRLWIQALRYTQPHLLAYLIYMVERLLHMKVILRSTGSIYLHCDPEASHYIKVMMDGIFGHKNFRNEIVWKRTYAHGGATRWGDIHDVILFYSMSDAYTWNRIEQDLDADYVERKYRRVDARGRYQDVVLTGPGTTEGDSGKAWRGYNPTIAGRHWAVPQRALDDLREIGVEIPSKLHDQLELLYEHDYIYFTTKKGGATGTPRYKRYLRGGGQPIQDIILDIPPINSQAKNRLGFPTQKPVALLKRIIEASSNEGDTVFDPFCGCGTTIYAAHETGRQWIGCDIAILAVRLIEEQLSERYRLVEGTHFVVDGIPESEEAAKELAKREPFQFEHWAVELVGGFPTKKTGDKGIDGRIYIEMGDHKLGQMILSVKGGTIRPTDIRDLRGVIADNPDYVLGGFISLRTPTKAMVSAASEAGIWTYKGVDYPRIQLLTVKDIVEDHRRFQIPTKVRPKTTTGQFNLALE